MVVFDLLVNCVSELHSPVQSQPGERIRRRRGFCCPTEIMDVNYLR